MTHSLETRLARLERQVRWYRWLSGLSLMGLLAVAGLGAAGNVPEVIRAQRFEVVSPRGKPMVTLKTTGYGGFVQTVGHDGISGVSIGASANGGFVGVRDRRPTLFPRVELSTDETGGMLAVRNWNGFVVEVDRDGLAVAHTQEAESFARIDARLVLGLSEHGGHIRVFNAAGQQAATIRADPEGSGVFRAFGPDGDSTTLQPGG